MNSALTYLSHNLFHARRRLATYVTYIILRKYSPYRTFRRSFRENENALGVCGTSESYNIILFPADIQADFGLVQENHRKNTTVHTSFSALFPEEGRLSLYQVVESFRPAMARDTLI